MNEQAHVRTTVRDDLPALRAVIDAVALFPGEWLAAMAAPGMDGSKPDELWLSATLAGEPVGVAYTAPERMTEGCWNMLLLAVDPRRQRQGIGRALVAAVERNLSRERLLLVETSGLPAYATTRSFYARLGYAEEARIRDFYQAGEDKVVFSKALLRRDDPEE